MDDKKLIKTIKFPMVHKFLCSLSLICFVVVIIGGLSAQARFLTITFKAMVVMVCIALISRIVMRVISTYEEMNSGEA